MQHESCCQWSTKTYIAFGSKCVKNKIHKYRHTKKGTEEKKHKNAQFCSNRNDLQDLATCSRPHHILCRLSPCTLERNTWHALSTHGSLQLRCLCSWHPLHCIQDGYSVMWPIITHFPPPGRKKLHCILGWPANQFVIVCEWWNATLSHAITNVLMSLPTCSLSATGTSC